MWWLFWNTNFDWSNLVILFFFFDGKIGAWIWNIWNIVPYLVIEITLVPCFANWIPLAANRAFLDIVFLFYRRSEIKLDVVILILRLFIILLLFNNLSILDKESFYTKYGSKNYVKIA